MVAGEVYEVRGRSKCYPLSPTGAHGWSPAPTAHRAKKVLLVGWPKRSKLAHAFVWEYSYKGLKLAQLLSQLGVVLTFGTRQVHVDMWETAVRFAAGHRIGLRPSSRSGPPGAVLGAPEMFFTRTRDWDPAQELMRAGPYPPKCGFFRLGACGGVPDHKLTSFA
jgi:hypothetical protein